MRSLLRYGGLCVLLLLTHGATRPAQQFTTLVGTIGTDTVAVDRFTRNETTLEGVLLVRRPRTHTLHYKAMLAPQGRFSHLGMSWHDAAGNELRTAEIAFGIDSIRSKFKDPTERSFSARPTLDAIPLPPLPYAQQAYSMLDNASMVVSNSKKPGDVELHWIVTGAAAPIGRRGRRLAGDTVEIGFIDGPLRALTGKDGRLVWLSGAIGRMTVVVRRSEKDVDMAALTKAFASRDTIRVDDRR